MKIWSMVLTLCLISVFAYAEPEGEIIAKDIDNKGKIRLWVCHTVDGEEVTSNYPKINGHWVMAMRFNKKSFLSDTSEAEVEARILNDVKEHLGGLILKEFDKNAPKPLSELIIDYNRAANQSFMDANLKNIVGKKVAVSEIKYYLDTDNDTILDKEITLKTDGSKVEKNYSPPTI